MDKTNLHGLGLSLPAHITSEESEQAYLQGVLDGSNVVAKKALAFLQQRGLPVTAQDFAAFMNYEEQRTLADRGFEALNTLRVRSGDCTDAQQALDLLNDVLNEVWNLEVNKSIQDAAKEPKTEDRDDCVDDWTKENGFWRISGTTHIDPTRYSPGTWFERADGFAVKSDVVYGRGGVTAMRVGGFIYYSQKHAKGSRVQDSLRLLRVIPHPNGANDTSLMWSLNK
jgi:hypothetical protein